MKMIYVNSTAAGYNDNFTLNQVLSLVITSMFSVSKVKGAGRANGEETVLTVKEVRRDNNT